MKWRNVRLYLAAFATYAIVRLIQVWTLLISCDSVSMDFITTFNAIDIFHILFNRLLFWSQGRSAHDDFPPSHSLSSSRSL